MSIADIKLLLDEYKTSSHPIKISAGRHLSHLLESYEQDVISKIEFATKVRKFYNEMLLVRSDESREASNICLDLLKYR